MLARSAIWGFVTVSFATALLAAQGCGEPIFGYSDGYLGGNCPREQVGTPCCPCPLLSDCPDGPKPIPWECPNACDGAPPLPPRCCGPGTEPGICGVEDAGSDGDTDADTDGGTSSLCADGTCVPKAPQSWLGPLHMRFGGFCESTECPSVAPMVAFEGQTEPPPPSCAACYCDPPQGVCSLTTTWTTHSAKCGEGGVATPLNTPANWDGTCTTEGAIAAGKLCGGVPCVQSITFSLPAIDELPCVAHADEGPELPILKFAADGVFSQGGYACIADKPWPECGATGGTCVPRVPDFDVCVRRDGDVACPAEWPSKHVLYAHVQDNRSCSKCLCETTSGTCSYIASVYGDSACNDLNLAVNIFSSGMEACHNFQMPGLPLGSKSATDLTYNPGTCTPTGGQVEGDVVLSGAMTFCCLGQIE